MDSIENPYGVEVGQKWVSMDPRSQGWAQEVLSVANGKAQLSGEFRKSWVALKRFKPGSNGFRKVAQAPGYKASNQ